jgi:UTP--glucose-1-phosphate uridylyltransferase
MSEGKLRRVTKAVFPVAGLGTRFLPATKAMPKELLPIIDKPIIQYAVEEAVAAGITDLIFVTGRTKRSIEDHFDDNPELERELRQKGKDDLAAAIHDIVPDHVNCIFIRQKRPLGLGHAVLCAAPVIGRDPFCVLLADDVVRGAPSPTAELIAAYEKTGLSQLSVMNVSRADVSMYGIVNPGSGPNDVAGLVEKPAIDEAPSLLASIGRYVLEPEILDILAETLPGAGGEIQLADAINQRARYGRVSAVPLSWQRYDCGSKFGYLEAIVDFALSHDEYGEAFAELIARRAGSKGREDITDAIQVSV